MRATVSKTFRFEASHHLPNHDGKCRKPHGHSYRVAVAIHGHITEEPGHAKEGMVIDFGDVSATWEEALKPFLDHCDLNVSLQPIVTTAENIATWIIRQFNLAGIPATTVTVWETETSTATVDYVEAWANGELLGSKDSSAHHSQVPSS